MEEHLKSGDTVLNRFIVEQFIGRGAFGSVYLVRDFHNGQECILKVTLRSADPVLSEYVAHLRELRNRLSDICDRGIIVPASVLETDKFVYQTFPYLGPESKTLAAILHEEGTLEPSRALAIVGDIALALDSIHSRNVLHADIKPSNILITADRQVYLTDFGLARRSEGEESIVWVGTYRYAHPALRDYLPKRPGTSTASIQPTSHGVGAYVDIYALAIIAIEMLTGDPFVPSLISDRHIKLLLNQRSPHLRFFPDSAVDELCNLISRMLSASPDREGISAGSVSMIARTLAAEFCVEKVPSKERERVVATKERDAMPEYGETVRTMASVLERLETVAESLMSSTAIMVRTAERLAAVEQTEPDSGMLQEVNKAFETARQRIRASWNIGVMMTIACFILVFGMAAVATTLSVVRGENAWGIIFGGASISTIIGTLIWRPYDRIFRATILAQQLEIIHIQSISAFRATRDINRRIQVCREAVEGLQTLLRDYLAEQVKKRSVRRKKR